MATYSKPSKQVLSDCQHRSKIISLDSLESVDQLVSSHSETMPIDDISDNHLYSLDNLTNINTDTLFEKIQIQEVHSCVPSQKDLLDVESRTVDNREKSLTDLGENNLDKASFGAVGLVVSGSTRLCNVNANPISEVHMIESEMNTNIELGCSQDNHEGLLQIVSVTQSKTKHINSKYIVHDENDSQIAIAEAKEYSETETILPRQRQRISPLFQDEEEPLFICHSKSMESYRKYRKKQNGVVSKDNGHDESDLPLTIVAAEKVSKALTVLQKQTEHSEINHYVSKHIAVDDSQLAIGAAAEDSEAEKAFPNHTISLSYDDEEPVHISHSELMERYDKHSREYKRQKKKQKEVNKRAESSSVGITSNFEVRIIDNFLKRTFIHPVERILKRQSLDVNASCDKPVTQTEISKIVQSSDHRRKNNFLDSLKELKDCGWYWGPLSSDEAVNKLINKPHGSFLVRDSFNELYLLSVAFILHGFVHHIRIDHNNGKFSFCAVAFSRLSGYSSVKELIEETVKISHNGHCSFSLAESNIEVYLLHPVSRFLQMQSLQHMCRFHIRQNVRRDHIDHLPIPRSIKDYLKESQYYVEYLED